jgi:hypothetical protein
MSEGRTGTRHTPSSPSPLTESPFITNVDAVTVVDALVLAATLGLVPFCFPALGDPLHRGAGALEVAFDPPVRTVVPLRCRLATVIHPRSARRLPSFRCDIRSPLLALGIP